MRKKVLLILWALASFGILWLALSPHFGPLPIYLDKVLHIVFAFVLMIGPLIVTRKPLYIFGIGFLYMALGVAVEYVQATMPDRSAEFLDIVANIIGIFLAFIFFWYLRCKKD